MKYRQYSAVIISAMALASCSSFNQPYEPSGEFNPLDPAGVTVEKKEKKEKAYSLDHTPGTFLSTTSAQTVFFSRFPSTSDQPTKTLSEYTDVKVISSKGSYTKVEVVDTGEVGFIPTIMLGQKRSSNEIAIAPGGFINPEVNTPDTLPTLLPEGISAKMPEITAPVSPVAPEPSYTQDVPFTAPEPEYKGIAQPEIVDPLLPAE